MYAQKTVIRAPMGKVPELRQIIEKKYLPVVRTRPGFIAAYLLEQIDDLDACELILFWDSQVALENFNRTGMLQASLQSLAAEMPELRLHRQGYIIRVATGALPEALASV